MKIPGLFFVLLMALQSMGQAGRSKIDLIVTALDAENLIHSLKTGYPDFPVVRIGEIKDEMGDKSYCKKLADSLNVDKAFYKADFDNNGHMDLLVIGNLYGRFPILALLDKGNDSLQQVWLSRRNYEPCIFPKIVSQNGLTEIELYCSKYSPVLEKKELVYKYDDFIETNKKVINHRIEKIEYVSSGGCFGNCPKFSLVINSDQSAVFNAQRSNGKQRNNMRTSKDADEMKGVFQTQVDMASYNTLTEMINYIDFTNLENKYAVSWTDDQSSILIITYDNGKVKSISDYGLLGTYGLQRVYRFLFDLRFNQNWKPLNQDKN